MYRETVRQMDIKQENLLDIQVVGKTDSKVVSQMDGQIEQIVRQNRQLDRIDSKIEQIVRQNRQ